MAVTPGVVQVSSITAQALVRTGHTKVYWVTASNGHASEVTEVELSNSSDGESNDLWGCYLHDNAAGGGNIHAVFDPPIEFSTHLYVDMTNATTARVTVGYTG